MADENLSPILSGAIEALKEGHEKARRERAARHLDYQSKLVENFNYSPKEFFVLLAKNLDKRRIPGLQADLVGMQESITGSANRLYLMIARERFVYYVCAAPFGSGFFFSWRFVDERRPAKWYHMLGTIALVTFASGVVSGLLTGPYKSVLQAFGVDSQGIAPFNNWVSLLVIALMFTAIWSAMRLGSLPGCEGLANMIEQLPLIGRVFERFYRPDTYYRQDTGKMYQKAFEYAVLETIDAVITPQGVRHQGRMDNSPVVADLHHR